MSRSILVGLFSILVLSTGCSAQTDWTATPVDHPANPDAQLTDFVGAPTALDVAANATDPKPADSKGEEHEHNPGGKQAPAKDNGASNDHEKHSDAKKAYPLDTCVISGEKLGEHGKPYVFEHEGHEIRLCCKACLKDFKKDPKKYLDQIDAAAAKAADHENKK